MSALVTKQLLFISDLRRMFPELGQDAWYVMLASGELKGRKVRGKWATTREAVDAWLDVIANGDEDVGPGLGELRVTN